VPNSGRKKNKPQHTKNISFPPTSHKIRDFIFKNVLMSSLVLGLEHSKIVGAIILQIRIRSKLVNHIIILYYIILKLYAPSPGNTGDGKKKLLRWSGLAHGWMNEYSGTDLPARHWIRQSV